MAQIIELRRDTTVNWETVNPTLAEGELGIDITIWDFKIGDGLSRWNSLSYMLSGMGGIQVQTNWAQSDNLAVDYIKNKPTLLSTWTPDSTHRTITDTEKSHYETAYAASLVGRSQVFTPTVGQTRFTITNFTLFDGYYMLFQSGIEQSDNCTVIGQDIFFNNNNGGKVKVLNLKY